MKSLVGLAGQGIIVEALTHELHRIERNISQYAKETKRVLNSEAENYRDQIKNKQDSILHEILFLQHQLDHLEPTYKKNSMILKEIELYDFLKELYTGNSPMANKAKENGVKVNVTGENLHIKANKGVLVTIFDNIFLNLFIGWES